MVESVTYIGPQSYERVACFGGLYSNYLALEAAVQDAVSLQAEALFCLGDLGAFGPHPDRVFPLLKSNHVQCLQGNYDDSIGNQLDDCQCGYTDPRDNHFAKLSYDYTLAKTSPEHREFLRQLPQLARLQMGNQRVLLCHGSPRQTNEFLWESTTSTAFLERLCDQFECDVLVGTHSGIKWERALSGGRKYINVGVLGRPENDGTTTVWYAMLSTDDHGQVHADFRPIEYDYRRLMQEMRQEGLPAEFIETIETGYWTTCLEILPGKERMRGRW